MSGPPMIAELIDQALAARNKAEGDREIAGGALFRASEACLPCARPSLFRAFGVKAEQEFDAKSLRRFEVGHQTAAWISKQFQELGILVAEELPLFDQEWRLGGHVDFVVRAGAQGFVPAAGNSGFSGEPQPLVGPAPLIGVELKSVHSKSFRYKAKNGGVVAGDHQLMQAAFYSLLADRIALYFHDGKPYFDGFDNPAAENIASWLVLSVSKDDLTMQEDPVRSKDIDAALERIEDLNFHYDKGSLPPCGCGEWFYKFCSYYPDPTAGYKDRNPALCCPESWLGQVRPLRAV